MFDDESLAPRPEPPISAAGYDPVTGLEVGVSVSSRIAFGLSLHLVERVQPDASLDTEQLVAELDATLKTMDEKTGGIQC